MNTPTTASLMALTLAALSACARPSAAAPQPVIPVTVATAVALETRPLYEGPGSIVAAHTYRLGFEIAGRVASVRYDVGDRVAAGAILATIDPADYAAQYRAASARAASAHADAAKAAHGARTQERLAALDGVAGAQGQLGRAEAAARLAAANRRRYDELFGDGDVSGEQHDVTVAADSDAVAQVAAARAQLAQARAQNSLVAGGPRSEDLAAAVADAGAADAAAELAAVTLRKTAITAPADAYVQMRAIEPGSESQPGSVAFTLTDAREPETLVAVPESKLPLIAPGTRAIVTVGGNRYTGTVIRMEPAADVVTRTAQVRIRVPGLRARPGAVVDVALGGVRPRGDAAVPLASIVTAPDGSQSVAVFDAAHATTARRSVRVFETDGERALVGGIAPGTRVVSAGAHLVRPGAAVRVVSGS